MQQVKPTRASLPTAAARRFDVFVVEDYTKGGEEKANWIRVGVAFENKDGKGFNVQLTAIPCLLYTSTRKRLPCVLQPTTPVLAFKTLRDARRRVARRES